MSTDAWVNLACAIAMAVVLCLPFDDQPEAAVQVAGEVAK